ncbi:hypothetical protein QYE76_029877 [Lolium multiflorum]|uniref:Uncharacterized protein n=1 Tax=Lolium multiflorum TaxID=4521 RepID=A0AAD8QQK4_LOLMU|nr:hypothetical protein QYE76_029877 [Lolium multiflorum]
MLARNILLCEEQRPGRSHRLPPFDPAPPQRPTGATIRRAHNETNRIIRFMKQKMKDTGICSDDIVHFLSRVGTPPKRRAHRMSEMYGLAILPRSQAFPLARRTLFSRLSRFAKLLCLLTGNGASFPSALLTLQLKKPRTASPIEAERGVCRKRALDSFDPDPYIFWKDLKMGKTPASRLGRSPPKPTGSSDDLVMLEVLTMPRFSKPPAAAAENEALEEASNSTVVLQAELEELAKARKAAEEKVARLEEEHKECNQLILQTDALAHHEFFDYRIQTHAVKKVNARRTTQGQANLAVPWTPHDHLVALNARVSHMRAIDRNLSDIPDVASQLYRTLWPGEVVPDTFSLISDRLKGAAGGSANGNAALPPSRTRSPRGLLLVPELNLDALTGVREGAETDLDPILAAAAGSRVPQSTPKCAPSFLLTAFKIILMRRKTARRSLSMMLVLATLLPKPCCLIFYLKIYLACSLPCVA